MPTSNTHLGADFTAEAQQPLFASCNDNTFDTGLTALGRMEGVPMARLTLGRCRGLPALPLCMLQGKGCAVQHGAALGQAGRQPRQQMAAQSRAGQAQRAAEGQGCRAPLTPALQSGHHFLLSVRLGKGLNQGRSPCTHYSGGSG